LPKNDLKILLYRAESFEKFKAFVIGILMAMGKMPLHL